MNVFNQFLSIHSDHALNAGEMWETADNGLCTKQLPMGRRAGGQSEMLEPPAALVDIFEKSTLAIECDSAHIKAL